MPSSTLPTTTRSSLQPVLLLGLVLLLLLAVGGSLISGAYPLSAHQAWQALLAGPTSVGTSVDTSVGSSLSNAAGSELSTVVWQLRLPRIAAALLVGMALATAGATYQAMFRNPLVSPDILGVAAGAGLGASFAILAGLPLVMVQFAAFGGGLLAVSCVVLVATRVRHHDPILAMVLAGVAIGTLFAAGISLVKVLADPSVQLPSITFWLLGGLHAITLTDLALVSPLLFGALLPIWLLRWRINALSLSDDEAASIGVDVRRLRLILIACATLMTASAVAIAGIIGWIGLVIPHAARLLAGAEFSRLLPATLLLGGSFLLIADSFARSVAAIELPLGILTAFVGAPAFLLLLARQGRSA
ncbi:MAG: iron ABC transporter permease [Thauera sp.]|jgi:iron complex transport system permease protein|nr:iron ABC transporter permease [Thauera sp.]